MTGKTASIAHQMKQLVWAFALLTLAVVILAGSTLAVYQNCYRDLLWNLTTASEFNQDFKEEIDLKMYYYVIESRYSEGLPVEQVQSAQDLARDLLSSTTDKESLRAITSVLDLCQNLENKIYQIEQTASYDDRQSQLENNIYVLTGLIQEYMYNYLYCEAVRLNALQQETSRRLLAEIAAIALGGAAFILLMTQYTVKLSKSITDPMVQLNHRLQQIGDGDLTVYPPISSNIREICTFGEGVEQMVQRMGQLIQEATEKQSRLRHAELALLQAQINPHFLYNTMDTIIWLIEAEKTEEAVEMVSNLSGFFRHSLSKGADVIPLSQEICHVHSYLQIQQVRYKDILSYRIDMDPRIGGQRIPKLTLQPLVENALYHGIKLKRARGTIVITGKVDGTDIVLQVQDDGVGMSPERLEQLRRSMGSGERVGFGLSTVEERLRLFFGEGYGLQIDSTEGCGTTITARIPWEVNG